MVYKDGDACPAYLGPNVTRELNISFICADVSALSVLPRVFELSGTNVCHYRVEIRHMYACPTSKRSAARGGGGAGRWLTAMCFGQRVRWPTDGCVAGTAFATTTSSSARRAASATPATMGQIATAVRACVCAYMCVWMWMWTGGEGLCVAACATFCEASVCALAATPLGAASSSSSCGGECIALIFVVVLLGGLGIAGSVLWYQLRKSQQLNIRFGQLRENFMAASQGGGRGDSDDPPAQGATADEDA